MIIFTDKSNLDIIVHRGAVIDALTVGELKIGGDGGHRSEIVFSASETITGIEFGRTTNTFWGPGFLCALKIFTNLGEYGPYSPRSDCEKIPTINIPDGETFYHFFREHANATISHTGKAYVLTFIPGK